MKRDDWFRRTAWSAEDRSAFFSRLKRSRSGKAQYLRIQALHLAENGHHTAAIELLDEIFSNHPDRLQLASAHLQKAKCLIALNDHGIAIDEFRSALQAERVFPSVRTSCWLDFPWFVVLHQKTQLHDEVRAILGEFHFKNGLTFPVERYRYAAIRALLADADGNQSEAREFARAALQSAASTHSGFAYHPRVGLVREVDPEVHDRLTALAGL
jgi:tetratricopeptide (TPR) repeat protein